MQYCVFRLPRYANCPFSLIFCCCTFFAVVNNVIFKAVEIKDSPPYQSILPEPVASSSYIPAPEPPKIQAFVDLSKLKSTPDNQWRAPWLNIQRNKQRHVSSDNVIRSYTTVPKKYQDAASILKSKLDAKSLNVPETKLTTEISQARREALYNSHSGVK